ncbi:MAG TPA: pantoate--beta-alanine ligase [Verrucomicrobiae bacterium]|nr:pantoate--beta-alanine ligase [Verrucomicrobiae bacterium]
MRIVQQVRSMQRLALTWKQSAVKVGFVPTMGYLHAGHLGLVRRARQLVGNRGKVVVSIYVNPTQFGPTEDFSAYPRDLAADSRACRRAGVDVVFAPTDADLYPQDAQSRFSTFVVEESLSKGMEGASRPAHFRGVTTVVAKLFNIVLPDVAVFGAKDFQQAAVVQRMARDLNFPVRVVVSPTHREPDGLAMSSRNKYLTGDLRGQATVLWRAIREARTVSHKAKSGFSAQRLKNQIKGLVESAPAARLDYVEFFDPETLAPVRKVEPGTHMALAVFVGKTRLIDNSRL